MSSALSAILASLKLLLPSLEPLAQAQVDAFIVTTEAQLNAAPGVSPDWKLVETSLLGAVKVIIDAEGAKLAAGNV